MNAAFVLTWHEAGEERGDVIGLFERFSGAAAASVAHVKGLAVTEEAALDRDGVAKDDPSRPVIELDGAGVARLTDGHGADGGKCRVREWVINRPGEVVLGVHRCSVCGTPIGAGSSVCKTCFDKFNG